VVSATGTEAGALTLASSLVDSALLLALLLSASDCTPVSTRLAFLAEEGSADDSSCWAAAASGATLAVAGLRSGVDGTLGPDATDTIG
jgi:hypothetical protein